MNDEQVVPTSYHLDILVSEGVSPVSKVFNNRKRPAASEGLHFYKQVLHVDDFVTDQGLEKDTHETHQTILKKKLILVFIKFTKISLTYLHIFIFNLFT
ncbi:hypothetical protein DBR06_SOUSAS7210039, partial [Sousa chinensis]